MDSIIVIRGGGDLASGIALRLFRAGYRFLVTEIPEPLTVRRTVSFSEAIFNGATSVEGVTGRKAISLDEIIRFINDEIPIIIDKDMDFIKKTFSTISVLIDARMEKKSSKQDIYKNFPFVIGIGPGYVAGRDCNVVIETNRGHTLGRIYRQGKTEQDTGVPSGDPNRVLRAPISGVIHTHCEIGDIVSKDQLIAQIREGEIRAPFKGLLRGLIHNGMVVKTGLKIGDLDHKLDKTLCHQVSEKAMAIGGSVLEVLLSDTSLLPVNKNIPVK